MVDMADFSSLQALLPVLQSPAGAIAFVPLYALWVTLLLPGVWASMLAGALYGTWWGSLIVFVGACLGAEAAFLLGRTWLRSWAQKRLAALPKLQAVERAVSREGLKLVLLTRLSPAFPFSLLNFAYGLSEVSLRDYTIGLIGILPGTILFCGLGALAGDVARFGDVLSGEADPATWVLRIVGIVATVAVVGTLGAFALGPQVLDIMYEGGLDRRTLGLLAMSSGLFMLAQAVAQAVIALHGHKFVALSWLTGATLFVVVTAFVSDDLYLRVELGLVISCAATFVAFLASLRARINAGAVPDAESMIDGVFDNPVEG